MLAVAIVLRRPGRARRDGDRTRGRRRPAERRSARREAGEEAAEPIQHTASDRGPRGARHDGARLDPAASSTSTSIPGLTAIEVDVKDENGEVGFLPARASRARSAPRSRTTRHELVAEGAGEGRLPDRSRRRLRGSDARRRAGPDLAIRTSGGSVWQNDAGLGWANPYDKRVWDYMLSIGKAAARRVRRDPVRLRALPERRAHRERRLPRQGRRAAPWTIARFVHYASKQLKPLGVRVSVDVFGLSATHDLGVGQKPGGSRSTSTRSPRWSTRRTTTPASSACPIRAPPPACTVALSLRDFRNACSAGKPCSSRGSRTSRSRATTGRPRRSRPRSTQPAGRARRGFLLWNPSGVYTEEVLK